MEKLINKWINLTLLVPIIGNMYNVQCVIISRKEQKQPESKKECLMFFEKTGELILKAP